MTNACNININYKQRVWGYGSLTLLALLGLMFICPVIIDETKALEEKIVVGNGAAATVSVALDSEVAIDIMPTGEGTFASTSTSLTINTNNQEGYSLYMKTLDATNSMTSTDPNKTNVIQAVSGTPTASNFANNTWGYALTKDAATSATQYAAVPTTDTKIYNEPKTTTGDTYNLTFGAKVNTDLPAGQYSNSVMVSVVANPNVISSLTQLVYMQDMTAGICANTGEITLGNEVSKQLIDIRDGKQYWVSKLADGNCWMTQNLALDLNEKTLPLKPESSDIVNEWRPYYNTRSDDGKLIINLTSTERENYDNSWNLGQYVILEPTKGEACSVRGDGSSGATLLDGETLAVCPDRFREVYEVDDNDEHYLIGNYYQYNAATAGSGKKLIDSLNMRKDNREDVNAQESICPKGWTLPVADEQRAAGSYYNLLTQYGVVNWVNQSAGAMSVGGRYYDVADVPMYFVRSGYLSPYTKAEGDPTGPGLVLPGVAVMYVTATYDKTANRFRDLNITATQVYSEHSTHLQIAGPVRCVAR